MTKSRDDTHKHARVGGESALEVRRTWISTPLATNSGKADGLGGLGWQGCGGVGGWGVAGRVCAATKFKSWLCQVLDVLMLFKLIHLISTSV